MRDFEFVDTGIDDSVCEEVGRPDAKLVDYADSRLNRIDLRSAVDNDRATVELMSIQKSDDGMLADPLRKAYGHKYIKREGTSGHYEYTYAEDAKDRAKRGEVSEVSEVSGVGGKDIAEARAIKGMPVAKTGKEMHVSVASGKTYSLTVTGESPRAAPGEIRYVQLKDKKGDRWRMVGGDRQGWSVDKQLKRGGYKSFGGATNITDPLNPSNKTPLHPTGDSTGKFFWHGGGYAKAHNQNKIKAKLGITIRGDVPRRVIGVFNADGSSALIGGRMRMSGDSSEKQSWLYEEFGNKNVLSMYMGSEHVHSYDVKDLSEALAHPDFKAKEKTANKIEDKAEAAETARVRAEAEAKSAAAIASYKESAWYKDAVSSIEKGEKDLKVADAKRKEKSDILDKKILNAEMAENKMDDSRESILMHTAELGDLAMGGGSETQISIKVSEIRDAKKEMDKRSYEHGVASGEKTQAEMEYNSANSYATEVASKLTEARDRLGKEMADVAKGVDPKINKSFTSEIEDTIQSIDALIKGGGAGSRGGKVVGTTKSGKPIYESKDRPSNVYQGRYDDKKSGFGKFLNQHKDWSDKDHSDAHKHNKEKADQAKKEGNQDKYDHHKHWADSHAAIADYKETKAKLGKS